MLQRYFLLTMTTNLLMSSPNMLNPIGKHLRLLLLWKHQVYFVSTIRINFLPNSGLKLEDIDFRKPHNNYPIQKSYF